MSVETVVSCAQERIDAALQQLGEMNRGLPAGAAIQLDFERAQIIATLDALAGLLLQKGLVTEQELVDAKGGRLADLLEQQVAGARDMKRQVLHQILSQGVHQT